MDNVAGACDAAEYLIKLGHKRIAFVGGYPVFDFTELRLKGYAQAMQAANLSTEGLTFLGRGDEAVKSFLDAKTGATAIVFINDEHARRALPVLKEAGIRIPDDLSVTGFDDTDDALQYDPPLTTLSVDRAQIGYWTVRVLVDQIRNPARLPIRVIIRPRLTVRASCRAND
jgi:DNA-binding LacI/PurR family transcriptional regulator